MKSILSAIKLTTLLASLTLFAGCAGSSNGGDEYEVPTNLPPICRDIDFAENPDMREMCGVRKAHNKAYKNIPQQRYLIKPSETTIVKTNGKLELRFQNSLPIDLEGPIVNELLFNNEKRLEKIKNNYDYHEIYYNKGSKERIRVFKMGIPTDLGGTYYFCFRVPEKKGNARTRSKAMGTNIELMECSDFESIIQSEKDEKSR